MFSVEICARIIKFVLYPSELQHDDHGKKIRLNYIAIANSRKINHIHFLYTMHQNILLLLNHT